MIRHLANAGVGRALLDGSVIDVRFVFIHSVAFIHLDIRHRMYLESSNSDATTAATASVF